MSVVSDIKAILSRKEELEKMIENRKSALCCNQDGKNNFRVGPSGTGSGHSFQLKWDDIAPIVEKSIADLKVELDGITKKVEAIGALMGAKAD